MQKIHWILQKNLIKEDVFLQIKKALMLDNISFEDVKIIPFSNELPEIQSSGKFKIFYGSTTLILNAYSHADFTKGIFYDKESFSMVNYIEKWKTHMLNYDSQILTFNEITKGNFQGQNWFVRPIHDDKSFSGQVMSYSQIQNLEASLSESNNPYLNEDTLVAISKPKTIEKEWRHFIVNQELVSSSMYAENGQVRKSRHDVPPELLDFVKARCHEYVPNNVFVIDTALHENTFKIVECNCFNDTGFYDHDIENIIRKVNAFVENHLLRGLSEPK